MPQVAATGRVRTPHKLALRSVSRRRRQRLLDAVTEARHGADWRRVERAALEVGDPEAMELAGVVGVLMGLLFERATELRDDCAEVGV